MQHSRAAASRARQDTYAVHNNNGKAQVWFTITPDDSQCWRSMWYALGDDAAESHRSSAPSGMFRFRIVAEHPVAAALYFQRVLDLVIEHVIGWDKKKRMPYRRGGIFGPVKAWLRVVEEQGRLTLHAHFLIWLYGHHDIASQLNAAFKTSQLLFQSDFSSSLRPIKVLGNPLEVILQRNNLSHFIGSPIFLLTILLFCFKRKRSRHLLATSQ